MPHSEYKPRDKNQQPLDQHQDKGQASIDKPLSSTHPLANAESNDFDKK